MRFACLAIGLLWTVWGAAETLYRLPWAEGLSFMFTQAPDGRITSHFTKAMLHAVDIGMPSGVPVLAARAGVVEALEAGHGASAEEEPSSYEGNFVRVRHDDGTAAIYAHLAYRSIVVAVGEAVRAGQALGQSGASGDVIHPHLHFAVIRVARNSAGWSEEVSLPVKFYNGAPPVAFAPRAALRVTANYAAAVEVPRLPSESGSLVAWKRAELAPGDEAAAWCGFAAWLACGVAGFALFWKFSRE